MIIRTIKNHFLGAIEVKQGQYKSGGIIKDYKNEESSIGFDRQFKMVEIEEIAPTSGLHLNRYDA